jgi:two-component system response regulator (stage 0 sporulation protein F)
MWIAAPWLAHRLHLVQAMLVAEPHPPRILLADDDAELRELLAYALRADGYEVTVAADGVQLLDLVGPMLLGLTDRCPAEIVISDQRMPGLTGLSVLGGLRDLDCQLPFILITAFGDPDTHARAWRMGVTAVLNKPFELRELRAAIARSLPGP